MYAAIIMYIYTYLRKVEAAVMDLMELCTAEDVGNMSLMTTLRAEDFDNMNDPVCCFVWWC